MPRTYPAAWAGSGSYAVEFIDIQVDHLVVIDFTASSVWSTLSAW
jgi:hypothetical protein